jgi:excinuclease UvrABC ATPase subunit
MLLMNRNPIPFSFNSPYGACPQCSGLGTITEVDLKKIIPDPKKSIKKGGIAPLGEAKLPGYSGRLKHWAKNMDSPLIHLLSDCHKTH